MNRHLHIIAFEVPYPVAHGGLFDIYYKLIALHEAGVKIHLHCFTNRTVHDQELHKYCVSINYYPRKKGWRGFSLAVPYIVNSRRSAKLKRKLLQDNHPVLLEGVHSTYLLRDPAFASRKIILRLHNVEHEYYRTLYRYASSFFKRTYYLFESTLLKKYELQIANRPSLILTVSQNDKEKYQNKFGANKIDLMPVFTGYNQVDTLPGTGCFCLYHGNLSIAENEKAALWLLREVFGETDTPLVIAGRNPSSTLVKEIEQYNNASLICNPSHDEMNDLIKKAQCHVLPSFNSTGVKLKLINALYNGRHCIVNTAAVTGTGTEKMCHVADSAETFRSAVLSLFTQPLTENEVAYRSEVLQRLFNSKKNAEKLIHRLW